MTRRWPVAGVLFAVLWLFVRGVELTVAAVAGQFLVGLAVGLPIAYSFRRLYGDVIDVRRSLRVVPYALLYLLVFAREVIVANVDVAYRVLSPEMPIDSEVILVPLRVETDLGVTTIANTITITPGTVTLDYDPAENALYVHVIDGRDPDAIVRPIRAWEDYALGILNEPADPDDPPPEITVHPPETAEPPEPSSDRGRERRAEPPDGGDELRDGDGSASDRSSDGGDGDDR